MRVVSTRGQSEPITFEEALFTSYFPDGGMTMPETIPKVSVDTLKQWKALSYPQVVKKVLSMFISEAEVTFKEQSDIVDKAFESFDCDEVVKVAKLQDGLNIMELHHGETMAFKDLAMTCTAQFVEHFLKKRKKSMTCVIITSGDTGSSALYSMRTAKEVSTVVMYPEGMVSDIQKLMMTTLDDPTAHVYSVPVELEEMETFFQQMIEDETFVKENEIGTLNSLNWCRILVQVAHHVYGYLQTAVNVGELVNIIIPTGACGNLSGCVIAEQMGIPIRPICTTNSNNTLHRIVTANDWSKGDALATLAPAMNMTFLVNFERILWILSDRDSELMRSMMKSYYERDDSLKLPEELHAKVASVMSTSVATDEMIKESMRRCWSENNYAIDPHTACAVACYYGLTGDDKGHAAAIKKYPSLCVATAAAAKFPEILATASVPAPACEAIENLKNKTERFHTCEKGSDWQEAIKANVRQITKERRSK